MNREEWTQVAFRVAAIVLGLQGAVYAAASVPGFASLLGASPDSFAWTPLTGVELALVSALMIFLPLFVAYLLWKLAPSLARVAWVGVGRKSRQPVSVTAGLQRTLYSALGVYLAATSLDDVLRAAGGAYLQVATAPEGFERYLALDLTDYAFFAGQLFVLVFGVWLVFRADRFAKFVNATVRRPRPAA